MHKGILVSMEDLQRVYAANNDLHRYSREELSAGIGELRFMGSAAHADYLVSRESLFYRYFEAEGKKDITVIG